MSSSSCPLCPLWKLYFVWIHLQSYSLIHQKERPGPLSSLCILEKIFEIFNKTLVRPKTWCKSRCTAVGRFMLLNLVYLGNQVWKRRLTENHLWSGNTHCLDRSFHYIHGLHLGCKPGWEHERQKTFNNITLLRGFKKCHRESVLLSSLWVGTV